RLQDRALPVSEQAGGLGLVRQRTDPEPPRSSARSAPGLFATASTFEERRAESTCLRHVPSCRLRESSRRTRETSVKPRPAALLFSLILVLRLAIAAQYRGNFDSQSFLIVANAVLNGQNVYAATDRYNYSPVWSYVVAILWRVAMPHVGLFVLLVGLFANLVDVISAGVLLRLARDRLGISPDGARRSALVFFSNPVSVAVACIHGQFDGLAVLFLLAAVYAATAAPQRGQNAKVVFWLSM